MSDAFSSATSWVSDAASSVGNAISDAASSVGSNLAGLDKMVGGGKGWAQIGALAAAIPSGGASLSEMIAADAADLAASGLGEAQIADIMAQSYGIDQYAASNVAGMAAAGQDASTIQGVLASDYGANFGVSADQASTAATAAKAARQGMSLADMVSGGVKGASSLSTGLLAGSQALTGLLGYNAANKAAQTQADAANNANALTWQMYQQNQANQQPWINAGTNALSQLTAGTQPGGQFTKNFSPSDLTAGIDPGYAFRISEGNKALNASAAARGGLISGNALKASQDYGQAAASQEYQNAFNRYQTNRANILNPLQSLAGVGQSATNTLGNMGTAAATSAGNNTMSGAAATAAGYVGGVNALTGAANSIGSMYTQNNLIDAANNRTNAMLSYKP